MTDPKIIINEDPVFHADMIDAFRVEGTEVLYSEEDGVMLRLKDRVYEISAKTPEAMTKMAKLIRDEQYYAYIRPFRFLPEFKAVADGNIMYATHMCYTFSKELIPEPEVEGFEIRPLTMEHVQFVLDYYDHDNDSEDFIRERIEYGMIGAFNKDGECVGFIGCHGDSSIGVLKILPEYRRMGLATALEAKIINRRIGAGRIPYGHVVVGNEKSTNLQKSLGLSFTEKIIAVAQKF